QGHSARQVVPRGWLDSVELWHNGTHVLSGVCYMLGLLLFPDGTLAARRRVPLLLFVGLTAGVLSPLTVEDHTTGLVVLFGILTPIAGVSAQVYRYRRASTTEDRQRSRSLLLALALALAAASGIVAVTVWLTGTNPAFQQTTRDYEFTSPTPGTYVFVCDPHLDMVGTAIVDESADDRFVRMTAENIEFDKDRIVLPPDEEVTIRFTNKDADAHNVSIYRTLAFAEPGEPNPQGPVFIGELFSGQGLATLSFRAFGIVFIVIPIALFFGLIRFKLWDIDRFVNRTLVYTVLAGFITAVYAGVVIGIGTLLGAQAELNVGLSIVVILLVAMAFQPIRQRAQGLANRLIYGKRATPYEVLARFSERAADTYDVEEVLPQMARMVGEGTGAKRAQVWLRIGTHLIRSASWPTSESPASVPIADDGEAFEIEGADRVVAVRHQGELLGALAVLMPAGESLGPVEEKLLTDVAAQAGLLLRNTQLGAELRARLDELQASRQRIVAAQDAERRRIERDIHDGAQQHLVTLAMKLRLAQDLARQDSERARALLDELHGDTQDALQTVRDLARGIYPPILVDRGLVVALQAQARRGPNPITVHADSVGRYDPEVEAAVYFCCLEAIQNAAKYAAGAAVRVQLTQEGELLAFTIADEGGGFDTSATPFGSGLQNMADRAAALGGELRVDSALGQGTVVAGWVPARPHPGIG
ncbi:MAG: histidine kinase, partial [Actinomycetota bacterium]